MTGGLSVGLVIPDLWQQEAVRALQQGKDVVVQAPTGSGKTYIFELLYPRFTAVLLSRLASAGSTIVGSLVVAICLLRGTSAPDILRRDESANK